MGQQQLLLTTLSVILVGIAVTVGITMFRSYSITAVQDAIVMDIIDISLEAYKHKMRIPSLGGGGGTFAGFTIPSGYSNNRNAAYQVIINEENSIITVIATAVAYRGATVTAGYDLDLNLVTITGNSVLTSDKNGFVFQGW